MHKIFGQLVKWLPGWLSNPEKGLQRSLLFLFFNIVARIILIVRLPIPVNIAELQPMIIV